MKIIKRDFIYKIFVLISFFIFFQQVFVINIGSSFKIYELLAFLLMILFISIDLKIYTKFSFYLFIVFLIAPVLGNIVSRFNYSDYYNFYLVYPNKEFSLRYDMYLIPFIIYIYYVFNWVFINYAFYLKLNRTELERLLKNYLFASFIVSIYSLYGFIFIYNLHFPDIIPSFLDFRNNHPETQWRPSGFSSEAGDLFFMLTWSMIIVFLNKKIIKGWKRKIYILITVTTLFLTASSLFVALVLSVLFWFIFYKKGFKKKFFHLFFFLIILGISIYIFIDLRVFDLIKYFLYIKIQYLLSPTEHITSSSGIRGYQWLVGIRLWIDNLLFGVGGGNSYFHMWRFDWLNSADLDSPKNVYIKILSELGVFGFVFLIIFYLLVYKMLFAIRNCVNEYKDILFIGFTFTIISLNALTSIYSLYIWFNISIILSYLYSNLYNKKGEKCVKI